MATVSVSRTYDAPAKELWSIFADYGNVADIHPGIESSSTLKDIQGVGGQRVCEFGKGKGVDEEITVWDENETMTFVATSFRKLPMKHMAGSFHFEGDGPTTVTFEMDYAMKGGFLMDLMARRMMRQAGEGMLGGAQGKL